MKSQSRCPACGRRRKPSHEKRVGTPKAYSKDCVRHEDFDPKAWHDAQEAKMKVEQEIKAQAEQKVEPVPVQSAEPAGEPSKNKVEQPIGA